MFFTSLSHLSHLSDPCCLSCRLLNQSKTPQVGLTSGSHAGCVISRTIICRLQLQPRTMVGSQHSLALRANTLHTDLTDLNLRCALGGWVWWLQLNVHPQVHADLKLPWTFKVQTHTHTHTLKIALRLGVGRVPLGKKPLGAMMAAVPIYIRMLQPWF